MALLTTVTPTLQFRFIIIFQPLFNGEALIILRDGTELKLTRNRRDRLEQRLGIEGRY